MQELLIAFGSETGNAREMAEYLYRECVYRDLEVKLAEMNDIPIMELQTYKRAVFVCSTTGDGEEPKNMKVFWRAMLSRSLSPKSLSGLAYAVLGLGDSSYPKFNYVAKRMFRRIQGLGGSPFHTVGLTDDQHPEGADYQCYIWISELFSKIADHDHVTLTRTYRSLSPSCTFEITSKDNGNICDTNKQHDKQQSEKLHDRDYPFTAVMESNRRVTSVDHFQDVRLVAFDISGSGIEYKPGDVVWVYPQNTEEDVKEAAEVLNLSLDSSLTFTSRPPPPNLPTSTSIRDLLTSYLDIAAVPSRRFFEICADFTRDELEKEKFEEFTSLMGREELYSYVSRPRRTILEVLGDFHSVRNNMDLSYLLDIIPPIKPRGFSIASAQCAQRDKLEICVGVVRYKTVMKKERIGLCSNWLANLSPSSPVRLFVEAGSFHFPTDRPIIMVGPGTGCAPFRSLIQSRLKTPQQLLLFFGCRGEHHDYFFKDEWETIEKDRIITGPNVRVITAFSRDQDRKIYVQHRIVEHAGLVWELMQNGAVFCVAGNSKNMPFQVKDALLQVTRNKGQLSEEDSLKYIDQLVKNRLYQTETW